MSGMGGPTSSYAAAGIAFEFIGAHKAPHPATVLLTRWRYHQGGITVTKVLISHFENMYPASQYTTYHSFTVT
jgi:hypothetical protein